MFKEGMIIRSSTELFPEVIIIQKVKPDPCRECNMYECLFGYHDEGHLVLDKVDGVLEEFIIRHGGIIGGKFNETK